MKEVGSILKKKTLDKNVHTENVKTGSILECNSVIRNKKEKKKNKNYFTHSFC